MPKLTPAQMKAAVEEFKKRFTTGFYHGSPNPNIKAFDPMKSTVRDVDFVTPGVTFVTKSPKFADSFTAGKGPYISLKTGEAIPLGSYNKGSTMYPVSVDMANHFDPMSPEGRLLIEAYVAKKYADDPKMARQFKSRIEDPHSNWTTMESPAFLQHLRESGIKTFDVNESGYQNVGVLDPSKIRGKFAKYNPEEAESPDFMKAQGGLVGYAPGGKVVSGLEALVKKILPAAEREANKAKFLEGTKAVDAQGKPLTVYHGTSVDEDFDAFKKKPRWIHVTENPDVANSYTQIGNDQLAWGQSPRVLPLHLNTKNPLILDEDQLMEGSFLPFKQRQREWIELAKQQGNDSIYNPRTGTWMVPEPNQLKSTIGNQGTFDPNSRSLTKKKGGSV